MTEEQEITPLFSRLDGTALLDLSLIVATALLLILIEQRLLPWLANHLHGQPRHYLLASTPLLRLLIIAVALLLALPILIEPSLQNMIAILGGFGLAIAFALKDYVSSLIAGVVAAFENPYRPGDWIEIEGIYGEVKQVHMRTIELITPDDNRVLIPHSKLWSHVIQNANNGTPRMQCVATFYLSVAHDGRQVRELLTDVALTSPYLHLGDPINVVADELEWGTRYRIRAYPVDPRQQFRFITDLTIRGRLALGRIGVQGWSPVGSQQREERC